MDPTSNDFGREPSNGLSIGKVLLIILLVIILTILFAYVFYYIYKLYIAPKYLLYHNMNYSSVLISSINQI